MQGHFFSLFSNLLVKTQMFFAHLVFLAFSDHIELFLQKKIGRCGNKVHVFCIGKKSLLCQFLCVNLGPSLEFLSASSPLCWKYFLLFTSSLKAVWQRICRNFKKSLFLCTYKGTYSFSKLFCLILLP